MQCISVHVSRDGEELVKLDTYKAKRYLGTPPSEQVLPRSGGLEMVKSIVVPTILPKQGYAVVVSYVFSSAAPTDILVYWELDAPSDSESRKLAVFTGTPFGSQTQGITIDPKDITAPLVDIGEIKKALVLSVAARDVATGGYTVYFFNKSKDKNMATHSTRISCACEIAP